MYRCEREPEEHGIPRPCSGRRWTARRPRGAQTEMIHLYDLKYKGCISCFCVQAQKAARWGAARCETT